MMIHTQVCVLVLKIVHLPAHVQLDTIRSTIPGANATRTPAFPERVKLRHTELPTHWAG